MAEVCVEKRYDVPRDRMWDRIGDPGALAAWHPGVETTELVEGGAARLNTVPGGGRFYEPIVEQGDHRYTFRIVDSPLPLREFVSTILVRDDGAGGCVVQWEATFEATGIAESEAAEMVQGFFQAGLGAL